MVAPIQDEHIKQLLLSARTIGVVGLSPKESRPSNRVGRYLQDVGYRIIPVNPGPKQIFSITCYADLLAVPDKIDIVTIFRSPEAVPPIVEQAIDAHVAVVWMQLGIINEKAAQRAREAGLVCVMDRCIKIEHARLVA